MISQVKSVFLFFYENDLLVLHIAVVLTVAFFLIIGFLVGAILVLLILVLSDLNIYRLKKKIKELNDIREKIERYRLELKKRLAEQQLPELLLKEIEQLKVEDGL
ncbi:hypothetical protein [Candidatus Borrarchaeum sp.]|uniref:hypothetical protein n=1 Tax=Candidatus Borrarchaeum sp. TaxID=2846742 RepID=UPI0025801F99|nr:hypothetical protein [Candidatus Borrarchaeum sp.]